MSKNFISHLIKNSIIFITAEIMISMWVIYQCTKSYVYVYDLNVYNRYIHMCTYTNSLLIFMKNPTMVVRKTMLFLQNGYKYNTVNNTRKRLQ